MPPSNTGQFRDAPREPHVYMNGTAISCGEHLTAHKRHRWSAYQDCGRYMHRFCKYCGLSDDKWKDAGDGR